jgi:FAD/FMN-containing dehydrogenase
LRRERERLIPVHPDRTSGRNDEMTLQTKTIDVRAVENLRSRLHGALLRPGEEGYEGAHAAWNLNARQSPAVVVVAEDAEDVLAAVRFARDAGLGVGVMATGHGVGTPADGGVLINTSHMRGVRVDPVLRTARVEAGALWKDVIPAAHAHGLATLAGSAPHVGVVGYTMGGGFGWLGRRYGLNSAGVTEARVVTANGESLRVRPDENEGLLWGLKGGGGNFGIVTSLEFRLYPLASVFGGSVFYPVERAHEVLSAYARWSAGLPDEMTTAVAFMNIPPLPRLPEPLRGRSVVVVKGAYSGEKLEDGEELFRTVREDFGEPIIDTFGKMPVAEMDRISMDPVDPLGVIQHAEVLSNLSPGAVDALVRVAGAGSGSPLIILEIRQLGGALSRTPEHLNLLGSGRYSMNAIGATFTPEMAEGVRERIAHLIEETRPYQSGRTFVNFMEEDPVEDRVRAAYTTEDWERLVALKDEHDPHNLFRFNRNIPPSRENGQAERNGK